MKKLNLLELTKEVESLPLTKKSNSMLNDMLLQQVNKEIENALFYRSLSYVASKLGFFHTQKFFLKHSEEEFYHSDLILSFIEDRNYNFEGYNICEVKIPDIKTLKEMFSISLDKEKENTECLTKIQMEASAQKTSEGRLVYEFISKLVEEQIEEESIFLDYLAILDGVNDKTGELLVEHSLYK